MIRFEKVSKVFPGGIEAVRDLEMEIPEGEILVLLGTSGSGKTTTMKMVNRLVEPTGGRILIEGRDIMEQDPVALRRRIGYAIQHIGLFPHLTVRENIALVPRLLAWSAGEIERACREMLEMVGLPPEEFGHRYPGQLSGGQKQRVGVARALAANPPLVLMDEPFGALDPITREQLQDEFLRLQSIIRKTVIFVTHDIFEAARLGDRVALLDGGRLQQLSEPAELVENPANEFVDQFLGSHRFQLSLLTRRISGLVEPETGEPDPAGNREKTGPCLDANDSLVHALDAFKKSGDGSLPVRRGKGPGGRLRKSRLLAAVNEALGAADDA